MEKRLVLHRVHRFIDIVESDLIQRTGRFTSAGAPRHSNQSRVLQLPQQPPDNDRIRSDAISPILIRRFRKRQIFLAGSFLLVLAYLCGTLRPDSLALILAVNVVKGLANGATGPMVYAICADAVDYGEWKDGFSSAGLGTAMVQCVGKLGMAVGTAVLGGILSAGGFAATAAEQTAGGQQALISVYTWVPALFILCSGVIMFFNRLDFRYPEIIADLRVRREQQQKGKTP
jgi:GPH family glycoside/pentoside/hexuronide:cation symporter